MRRESPIRYLNLVEELVFGTQIRRDKQSFLQPNLLFITIELMHNNLNKRQSLSVDDSSSPQEVIDHSMREVKYVTSYKHLPEIRIIRFVESGGQVHNELYHQIEIVLTNSKNGIFEQLSIVQQLHNLTNLLNLLRQFHLREDLPLVHILLLDHVLFCIKRHIVKRRGGHIFGSFF